MDVQSPSFGDIALRDVRTVLGYPMPKQNKGSSTNPKKVKKGKQAKLAKRAKSAAAAAVSAPPKRTPGPSRTGPLEFAAGSDGERGFPTMSEYRQYLRYKNVQEKRPRGSKNHPQVSPIDKLDPALMSRSQRRYEEKHGPMRAIRSRSVVSDALVIRPSTALSEEKIDLDLRPRLLGAPPAAAASSLGDGRSARVGISSMPANVRSKGYGKAIRRTDTCFIQTITLPDVVNAGTIIWSRRNLAAVPSTALEVECALYNRWRIRKYRYRLVPVPGTNFAGMLVGATDPDVVSVYSDPSTNVQRLTALPGRAVNQIWEGLSFDHPDPSRYDLFVNDFDPNVNDFTDRFSCAGNSMIAVVAAGDMSTGTEIGAVFLDYDIELYEPHLEPAIVTSRETFQFDTGDFLAQMGNVGGTAILDYLLSTISAVGWTPLVTQFASNTIRTFFDYVPWFVGDGSGSRRLVRPTELGLVRGHLGASPTEQPGIRPGRYELILWYADNTLGQNYNPTSSTYNGPIDLASYSSPSTVVMGGDLDPNYGTQTLPQLLVGAAGSTPTHPGNFVFPPGSSVPFRNWMKVVWSFGVRTGRAFSDVVIVLNQSVSNPYLGPFPDSIFWLEIVEKDATSYIVLPPEGGTARARPRYPVRHVRADIDAKRASSSVFPRLSTIPISTPPSPSGADIVREHTAIVKSSGLCVGPITFSNEKVAKVSLDDSDGEVVSSPIRLVDPAVAGPHPLGGAAAGRR